MVFNFGVPIYLFLSLECIKLNFLVVPAQNAIVILYEHFKRSPADLEKVASSANAAHASSWALQKNTKSSFFAVINRALYIVVYFCDSSIAVIMQKLDIPVWSPVCGIFIS